MIQLEEKFQQEIKRMTEMQQFELIEKDKQFEEELQGLRKQNSEYEAMLQAYKNFKVGQQELRDAVEKITLQDKRKLNLENYGENEQFAIKNIQLNEKERKVKTQEEANLQERRIIQDLVTQLNQKEKELLNSIAVERQTLQEQYNSLNQIQNSFKSSENKHKNEYESLKQSLDIFKDDLDNQIQRMKSDYKILEKQYQLRVNKFENDKKKQNEMNQQLQLLINQRDQEIQQTLEELHMLENEITTLTKQLDLQEMELAHQEDQFEKQKNEQELNAIKIKNAAKSIKLQHSEVERKQKMLETKKNEVKLKQLQIETYLNKLQQQENELNSEKIAQQSQQQTLHEMRKTLMSTKTMPFSGNTDASATRSITKMTEFERVDAPKSRMKTNQLQRIQDSAEKSNNGASFKKFDFENYKQELGLYENEIEGNSQYMNQSKQNVFNLNNQFTY